MILKVIKLSLVGSLIALQSWATAMGGDLAKPNNWVPFPWAKELPITMSSAQGVWLVTNGNYSSYFYVKVTRDSRSSTHYLSIIEKDGATCEVIATGFGTEQATTRISAEMTTTHRQKYDMLLRQYDPSGLPGRIQSIGGKVMVLTIIPKNSRKSYNFPLAKVSERTEYVCEPKK